MKIKILLPALITLICFGCTTPKFYAELTSTYPKGKQDDDVMNAPISPHKLVLNALRDELQNTEHIIYHYSPYPEWDSKEFSGAVYDVEKDKYYYFENSKEHPKKLSVSENYQYPNDNYYKFVIDNFRKGRIDYLKKLGETSNLSGYTAHDAIYDIDLKNGTSKRYTFGDFLFMNGKPTKDVEE